MPYLMNYQKKTQRKLSSNGQTSWAYANYSVYNSGIVIFDGQVSKIVDDLLDISTDKNISEDLFQSDIF